jgi:hypothetical protein
MLNDDGLIGLLRARVGENLRPSVSLAALKQAEERLGMSLDPFLGRVYLEVSDGGFGPGYGARPLVGVESVVSTYADFRAGGWPAQLLPVWDWGDAIWSCIDPHGHVVTKDDVGPPDFTTRTWLRAWLDGVNLWEEIYEDKDASILNPFTRKPIVTKVRGAARGRPWPLP